MKKDRVKITDDLLDKLGFNPYHDCAGNFGERCLREQLPDKSWRTIYTVYDMDEDYEDPRDADSKIIPQHYNNEDFQKIEYFDELKKHFEKRTGRNLKL